MIQGSFTSATGVVTIAFDDGNVPVIDMDITQIGELSYNFDITPEGVTIDRLLALYTNFRFSFNSINSLGDNVYDLMVDSLLEATTRAVTLRIVTHDNEDFEFKFTTELNDISIDEASGVATMTCKPFVSEDTFKTVFDSLPTASRFTYGKTTLSSPFFRQYDATLVGTWIKQALPRLFGNNHPVDFVPSKSNLDSERYTENIYSDSTNDLRVDVLTGARKTVFSLVDMGAQFASIEEGTKVLPIAGTASVGYEFLDLNADDPDFDPDEPVVEAVATVDGSGTSFESLQIGQELFRFDGTTPVLIGTIVDIISNTRLILQPIGTTLKFDNEVLGVNRAISPNQRPALEVLKELAGIEGSIFGSGFSRNFYINRLTDTQTPVTIDYDKVISASLKRTNLYLGTSIVSQLATFQFVPTKRVTKRRGFLKRTTLEFGETPDDPFGIYPASSPTVRIDNFQLPVMSRQTSVSRGNPRASKELRIELAPAYPLLNKGRVSTALGVVVSGNESLTDNALESALTASGLRNYLRALNSVDGDFVVELQIKGAFSIKPYETFTLSNAPERYQGKVYRVSQVSYNLVGDIVKVKGYKINAFEADIIPSSPAVPAISVSNSNIRLDWDTTKPSVGFFDVQATGISGSLEIACSAGFYSINTESTDNLWRNSIVLNTDGFGRVSKRIYVRFSPSASGIVSDSLLYGVVRLSGSGRTANVNLTANVIAPQQEFYIGQVDGIIGDDAVTEIPVNMFTEIERGREITLVGENKGNRYTFTVNQDIVPTGQSTITVEEQFIEKDRYHVEASQNADRTGITVSEREIVLKVRSDGNIASIRLSADADDNTGSEINIVADQVKINDIRFEQLNTNINTGLIESIPFATGVSGWRIDGNGNAEFTNVVARGRIEAEEGFLNNLSIDGTLSLNTGEVSWSGGNIDSNGIKLVPGTTVQPSSGNSLYWATPTKDAYVLAVRDSGDTLLNMDIYADTEVKIGVLGSLEAIRISKIAAGIVFINNELRVQAIAQFDEFVEFLKTVNVTDTTDSTSASTGALRTSGGLGVAKNVWAGKQLNAGETFHLRGTVTYTDTGATIPADVSVVRINDTSPSGFTYTLPSATGSGKLLTIKDVAGDAGSEPHTFNRAGSDTIDNDLSISLNTNFGRIILLDGASGRWDVLTKE